MGVGSQLEIWVTFPAQFIPMPKRFKLLHSSSYKWKLVLFGEMKSWSAMKIRFPFSVEYLQHRSAFEANGSSRDCAVTKISRWNHDFHVLKFVNFLFPFRTICCRVFWYHAVTSDFGFLLYDFSLYDSAMGVPVSGWVVHCRDIAIIINYFYKCNCFITAK